MAFLNLRMKSSASLGLQTCLRSVTSRAVARMAWPVSHGMMTAVKSRNRLSPVGVGITAGEHGTIDLKLSLLTPATSSAGFELDEVF